jgi:signal transduction histidine kinase
MATIENSVARMQKLLQQLQSGDAAGPTRDVDLRGCVEEAVQKCAAQLPKPVVTDTGEPISIHIDAERFVSIIAHLLRNAQDATDNDGSVTIAVSREGAWARILISDDGCGMEDEFIRSRLFRPFDSTKGSQGMGIGAYQARTFIVAAGGSMIVRSQPEQGTMIDIQLPLAAVAGATGVAPA